MTIETKNISKSRLAIAFATFTLGTYLLAFTSQFGLATLHFCVAWIAMGDFAELKKPIAPRKRAIHVVLLTIILVGLLLASAFFGFTKTSNEWFMNWPLRPYLVMTCWVVIAGIFVISYRNKAAPEQAA